MTTEVWTPTPGDLLRQAADIAEAWGTCTGTFLDSQGRVCEIGALRAAAGLDDHIEHFDGSWTFSGKEDKTWWPIYDKARDYLFSVSGGTAHNDSVATTDKERVAKLREAAAYADKQENK